MPPRQLNPDDRPRPGDDLPEVPGEGPATALRLGRRPGRRPGALAGGRADPGPARRPGRSGPGAGAAATPSSPRWGGTVLALLAGISLSTYYAYRARTGERDALTYAGEADLRAREAQGYAEQLTREKEATQRQAEQIAASEPGAGRDPALRRRDDPRPAQPQRRRPRRRHAGASRTTGPPIPIAPTAADSSGSTSTGSATPSC